MNQPQPVSPSQGGQPIQPKPPMISTWLLVVFIIVLLGGGGYLGWYFWNKSKTKTTTPSTTTTTPSTTTTTPSTTTTDPTADWKTYTDSNYTVTFKYPNTWQTPNLSVIKKEEAELIPGIAVDNIDFKDQNDKKYVIKLVEISPLADYKDNSGDGYFDYNKYYTAIMNVYNNKSAAGADKLWMPPSNASITAASAPVYFENSDGTYRGIYYFANIGQEYSTELDLIAVLTNGKNVFQLYIAMASDKAAQYPATNGKNDSFSTYVSSLNASSSETIAKEFTSTYQYILKSVK